MGVLETIQSNRSEEMERTSAELEAIKTDKNRQIVALTRQVQMFQKEAQQQRETHFLPVQDIQQIRNQMNKGSEARTRRHAQFDSIVQDLATLTDATVADETGARMTKMIDILDHHYKMEGDQHSKIVALSQPNETVKELQKRVALIWRPRLQSSETSFVPRKSLTDAVHQLTIDVPHASPGKGGVITAKLKDREYAIKRRMI
jgi:hypothetical protein